MLMTHLCHKPVGGGGRDSAVYAYREYFDDFDHKSVYSHVSLADYLAVNGYQVFLVEPRFMPVTVKGRLPVAPWLIRV